MYIASKFNDETRAKLVVRWEKLEKQAISDKRHMDSDIIEEASAIAGSQTKLAIRLGISTGELSLIKNGNNSVSQESINKVERLCNLIIMHGLSVVTSLNDFDTFELIAELKNRGITGNLSITI